MWSGSNCHAWLVDVADLYLKCAATLWSSFHMLLLPASCLIVASCIPTTSRTHARVASGTSVNLSAGGQWAEPSTSSDGDETNNASGLHLQADVQYGVRREHGGHYAIQLKVPPALLLTAIDGYYQFLGKARTFAGAGVELSAAPAIYGVLTRHLTDTTFVTFTPRLYWARGFDGEKPVLNPQIAFGRVSDGPEISALISVAHHLGRGHNLAIDGLEEGQDGLDVRKTFVLVALSLRI